MLNLDEIWRIVPPEEKLQMMAKAHSKGLMSSCTLILVAGAIAIGLHLKLMFWGAIVVSPLIFQFSASKAWRDLKPRSLLEYLAVRSVVRRYAYSLKATELGVQLIFKGYMRVNHEDPKLNEAFNAIDQSSGDVQKWIALLDQALVVVTEGKGGARLEFGCLLDEKLRIQGSSLDGKEYSQSRELMMTLDLPKTRGYVYTLKSDFPVALNAFERKLLELQKKAIARRQREHQQEELDLAETQEAQF